MTDRADQLEVLRYWEEIELLTPPEYRNADSERRYFCEWKAGRMTAREREVVERWQGERWTKPFEFPERLPRGMVLDYMPVFTVYLGILPKKDVYDRLLTEIRASAAWEGKRSGRDAPELDSQSEPPAWMNEFFGSSASSDAELRGTTVLATFALNPWGKYIDQSFKVSRFVGALTYLRGVRSVQFAPDEHLEIDMPAGTTASAAKLARMFEACAAQVLHQEAKDEGTFIAIERFKQDPPAPVIRRGREVRREGDDDWIRLNDPHPEALPVPEGFIMDLSRSLSRAAGFDDDLPLTVSVSVRLCRPNEKRLPDETMFMESFFIDDIRQARAQLERAGAMPFGAPDFAHYAAMTGARGDASIECSVDPDAAAPADSEAFARPIGAPLARLLALGADENLPRVDFLKSPEVVADLVSPQSMPRGRWPSNISQHLYLCQQAALSAILRMGPDQEKGFGPLLSVNGPPGTGKSWLVRELTAEIVVRRARKIAAKASSREVFAEERTVEIALSGDRTESFTPFAEDVIKDSLILLASNNNAALRNITDAMPRSYGRRPNIRDARTGGERPAFSYWRDCALGVMASIADTFLPKAAISTRSSCAFSPMATITDTRFLRASR